MDDVKYACYNGSEWVKLLIDHPECAGQCNWDALDGCDWGELLRERPQFADRCPWGMLGDEDWANLLVAQPQFAERPEWAKFKRKRRIELVLEVVFWAVVAFGVYCLGDFAWSAWKDYPDSDDPSRYAPQERYERGMRFLDRMMFKEGNKKNALKWIESAANEGCVSARFTMGYILAEGELGVAQNEVEALKWYRLAFVQKNMPACFAEVKMKLPQLSFFPRCKLGEGFAPCVLATDTGCVLIAPINAETDVEAAALNLEKSKEFLMVNEPGTGQMMAFLMNGDLRIDENAYEARGIRCLSERELINCAADYFSEAREQIRGGEMHESQKSSSPSETR